MKATKPTKQEYNGYANHETWKVANYISNDEALYNLCKALYDDGYKNENAKRLDRIAESYCLTRASLCRLIVTQFLDDPTQKIHINNTNHEHTEHNA
jgi:hypothetical protein